MPVPRHFTLGVIGCGHHHLLSGQLGVCRQSDIIIMGFKPQLTLEILSAQGFKESIQSNFIISVLPGKNIRSIISVVGCDSLGD